MVPAMNPKLRQVIALLRRHARRLREFRECVRLAGESAGWLSVAARLYRGGRSAWRSRRSIGRRVRHRRWRVCARCPLLDREARRCTGCGCYAPFLVSVNQDCYAAERGGTGPLAGWRAERR